MKSCNSLYACSYKTGGGASTFIGCSYYDYCDYQCPRDSRGVAVDKCGTGKCQCVGKRQIMNGLCPFCGKLIT